MRKAAASLWMMAATACTVAVLWILPITPKVPVSTVIAERGELTRVFAVEAAVGYAGRQPVVALLAGEIERVCVQPGQRVRQGELLASMNVQREAEAIAALYRQESQQQPLVSGFSTLPLERAELGQRVAASQLRAPCDAVVEQVYVEQGSLTAESTPALLLRQEELELTAVMRLTDTARMALGDQAVVIKDQAPCGTAAVSAFGVPNTDAGTQQVRFSLQGGDWRAGDTVELEVVWDVRRDATLVPVSALGESGSIWVVEQGRARAVRVDDALRNSASVCVPNELAGLPVVLLPDEGRLRDGCWVKEQKP